MDEDETAMYPGHHGEEWGWECGCCGAPMIMATGPGMCSSCALGNGETNGGS
jgi:hypothetical protein